MGLICSSHSTETIGVEYSKIKKDIKPFDLVFFRGSELVSDAISMMEKLFIGRGDWTHVGIVITNDIIPIKNSKDGKLYIWESTMSGKLGDGANNVETDSGTFGVQIRDLDDVIIKYNKDPDSRIGWSRLIDNPLLKKDNETEDLFKIRYKFIIDTIRNFHNQIGNAVYDYNITHLCSVFFPICKSCPCLSGSNGGEGKYGANKYFCSELVAQIYKLIGIIPDMIDPEHISPVELLGQSDLVTSPVEPPVVIRK